MTLKESRSFRYGAALVLATAAYCLQRLIWPLIPPTPDLLFYPAVFLAAWLYGAGPGYLATIASCFWIADAFLPPEGLLVVSDPGDVLDLALFAGVAFGVSYVMGRLRGALRRERQAAEEARLARAAVEATWSMVAHDLRTPLSIIQLSSTDLQRRLTDSLEAGAEPDSARVERTLKTIERGASRANDLVSDAVDAMRLANGVLRIERSPCDARSICTEALDTVQPLAQKKSVDLSMRIEGDSDAVCCDAPRIVQVLSNLLGNAIKFTPSGGRIVLAASATASGVRFSVSDTGAGISDSQLEKVFSKFWTSDRSAGLGLGLWIARAIVEAHGGTLDVASRKGEGTTFSFVLEPDASPNVASFVPVRDVMP